MAASEAAKGSARSSGSRSPTASRHSRSRRKKTGGCEEVRMPVTICAAGRACSILVVTMGA